MPRVIHFEIYADDPDRATKFYSDVFGWSFQTWDGPVDYWLATTGTDDQPGINGAIARRPAPGAVGTNFISVSSVEESVARIVASGGTQEGEKMAVPGVGYAAFFRDSEGNLLGLFQDDPSAQ